MKAVCLLEHNIMCISKREVLSFSLNEGMVKASFTLNESMVKACAFG